MWIVFKEDKNKVLGHTSLPKHRPKPPKHRLILASRRKIPFGLDLFSNFTSSIFMVESKSEKSLNQSNPILDKARKSVSLYTPLVTTLTRPNASTSADHDFK
jgi:hypothetical protein